MEDNTEKGLERVEDQVLSRTQSALQKPFNLPEGVNPQICINYRLRIGRIVASAKSGKSFPKSEDHFNICLKSMNDQRQYAEFEPYMNILRKSFGDAKGKLRALPIQFLFRHPDENLQIHRACISKGFMCSNKWDPHSDKQTAKENRNNIERTVECKGEECQYASTCRRSFRLFFTIGHPSLAGVPMELVSTSKISLDRIIGHIMALWSFCKGNEIDMKGFPAQLSVSMHVVRGGNRKFPLLSLTNTAGAFLDAIIEKQSKFILPVPSAELMASIHSDADQEIFTEIIDAEFTDRVDAKAIPYDSKKMKI